MPFSEKHITVIMVTIQYFDISLCSWILVFVNFKFSCTRNLFIYFNRVKIKSISVFNKNFRPFRYLFPNFGVNDLRFLNKFLCRHQILIDNVLLLHVMILISFCQHISYLLIFHLFVMQIFLLKIEFFSIRLLFQIFIIYKV